MVNKEPGRKYIKERGVRKSLFSYLIVFLFFQFSPVIAQEIPVSGEISHNLQKYTGFSWFVDNTAEVISELLLKIKTKAKKIKVDIDIYSGLDLIQKKTRSVKIYAETLLIKKIPIDSFELQTGEPVYFIRRDKRYKVKLPLDIDIKFILNPSSLIFVISDINKDKKDRLDNSFEIDLPLPPLGSTRIVIKDVDLKINQSGRIYSKLTALSKINPDAEPIHILVEGNLVIRDKKLFLDELKSEIDGIFTHDSDVSVAFCQALEELLNPLINFNKYEKEGIKINRVGYTFEDGKLKFNLNVNLSPE